MVSCFNDNKKPPKQRLLFLHLSLAGLPNHRWNQILSDLILFAERLEGLGFRVVGGEVVVANGVDA